MHVGLDARAKFTEADRKAEYDAAMRVGALFGDESALMDRILFMRGELAKSDAAVPENDPLRKRIKDLNDKIDNVHKKIVATKEGGAVTGEQRLREHTDQLYGALLSFEGRPGDYQVAYIDALRHELGDVGKEFDQVETTEIPRLNEVLKSKGQPAISPSPANPVIGERETRSATDLRAATLASLGLLR